MTHPNHRTLIRANARPPARGVSAARYVLGALLALVLLPATSGGEDARARTARVEVGLAQTAVSNPPIGVNEFGDMGGTSYSAGNLIPDSGFEPVSIRRRVRVGATGMENGRPWFEFTDNGGISNWDLTAGGFLNGAAVRVYRIVDARGQALPQGEDGYLDLANADAYALVGTGRVPEAGAPGLPFGGWVDTAYAVPGPVYGTRTSLDFTDASWVENGRTYYYIVTAIGSNGAEPEGGNESDPAQSAEISAAPRAGSGGAPRIAVESGDGFNEIGNARAGSWFRFQPRAVGARGAVRWELLDANGRAIRPPAGLAFDAATGELAGDATATPPPTRLRFRATASNGIAVRDFVLNNPEWAPTGASTRPLPPTAVAASAGDGFVHLSWRASPSAGVVGYRIYRAETPRARQVRRVYLDAGAPALVRDDYVHLEKRVLAVDPAWAHPRVRTGVVNETWRADPGSGVSLRRAAHGDGLPAEFRFPGDSCLEVTATRPGGWEIGGPYVFFPSNDNGEAAWYGQLEPGRRYRYEAWLRTGGPGNVRVTLGFNQAYQAIAGEFEVTPQWRLYGFEFIAPERPTQGWHICPTLRASGPGTLRMDNIRLFRADTDADVASVLTPPSPLVFDELLASQPAEGEKGILRSMGVLLNQSTMAGALSLHRDAGAVMTWYQGVEGAPNMTVPLFLQYALRTGSSPATRMKPWLNISSHMREDEWLALVEYLAAPIDPSNPADLAAKPWARLRWLQRGVATPWTDEFSRIYVEFANETWHNGAVSEEWFGWGRSGWVHGGAREFGLAADYYSTYLRDRSPYFAPLAASGRLRLVLGSNYENYGETAAAGAPLAAAVGHASYVGPKWEAGETPFAAFDDHGIQATLLGYAADTELLFRSYRRSLEALAASGHPVELVGYEGGPSGYSLPGQDAPEQHANSERYGKSLAMAVAALDAWLGAYRYGFSEQAYLGFAVGDYWSSHTRPDRGYRAHAGWLALTLRNRYATGRMVESAVVESPTIEWDGAAYPLVSSYAFRDGNRFCVFLLSRALGGSHDGSDWGDGSIRVTLVLPAAPTGPATLYSLEGDPRANNIDAANVAIRRRAVTLGRETSVVLPQGSIQLYVVDTAAPDRDEPFPQ